MFFHRSEAASDRRSSYKVEFLIQPYLPFRVSDVSAGGFYFLDHMRRIIYTDQLNYLKDPESIIWR